MMISAALMCFGFENISRCGCVSFSALSFVWFLHDKTKYNNHEYLYSTIPLVLALCDCHPTELSVAFMFSSHSTNSRSHSMIPIFAWSIPIAVVFLMINCATYGIPGWIAVAGMGWLWISLAVILAYAHTAVQEDMPNVSSTTQPCARSWWSASIDAWCYSILQKMLCLVYFYAGLAKFEPDWVLGSTAKELLRSSWWLPWYVTAAK